jgi:NADH:ubiquinone oxidoreductase subunit
MSFHTSNLKNFLREIIFRKTNFFVDVRKYGLWPTIKKYYVQREAWWEKEDKVLAGVDKYGNEYWYTTKPTEIGRQRWVQLNEKRTIWDASDIPAEWHMWIHYVRDEPPTAEEIAGADRSVKPMHYSNNTGNNAKRYYPPGHFFNPHHVNPVNAQRVKPFDCKQSTKDTETINEMH